MKKLNTNPLKKDVIFVMELIPKSTLALWGWGDYDRIKFLIILVIYFLHGLNQPWF